MQGNNETSIRDFDYATDLDAIKRIWREVGWVDETEDKYLDDFFAVGDTLTACIAGVPECSAHTVDGSLRLQSTDLPLCAVTAVTTSRIARGQAFAKRLTALQLQRGAQDGAAVAALGIFDQGYYDKLGFGTGGYDHQFIIDPANLKVDVDVGMPRRLGVEDFALVHAALTGRAKVHGSVVLHPARLMRAELAWAEKGFGLGYGSDDELTHFVWLSAAEERGPYDVKFMAYQNTDQLLQLLALLKSFADQVYSLRIIEPPEVQLQSLLNRPFRNQVLTRKSQHAAEHYAFAWWQLRVLDVPACVQAYRGVDTPVRFQLEVTDPVEELLHGQGSWHGVGGEYVVVLGETSSAEPGVDKSLPRLRCSVNALTRMLWGVAKPASLAVTDDLSAQPELLDAIGRVLQLPTPHPGWDF